MSATRRNLSHAPKQVDAAEPVFKPNRMSNYHGAAIAWANREVHTPRVDFGRVKYIPGGFCGPRRQRDYQLVVLQSGGATVKVDDVTIELPPDQAALFLPGHAEHFVFSPDRETEHVWCSIRPGFMPQEFRWRLEKAPRLTPCSELMHRLFAAAQAQRRTVGLMAGRAIEHLGLALFAAYLDQTALWSQGRRRDESVGRAMAWIEDHFGEDDCLERARQAAGCSESSLNQQFRCFIGTSPARYLWNTRVERGIGLLRDTGLTVAEISFRCGCKNPFHFSRLIKRNQGVSPREVRRRAWQ